MKLEDLILVSVDDHAIEPPNAFKHHMPERFKGREPHVEKRGERDVWVFEEEATGYMGLNSVVGRPKEEYGMEPLGYDQMRRGTWDVKARVDDMNANGVLGSLCFPTFPGFAGQRFQNHPQRDIALAAIQAYNDWHVEEWCGAYPARFIPMTLPVIWDPVACAAEIRRNAARGVHSLTFSENPSAMGYPSFHDFDYWKPMWDALVDTDTVLNVHIGSSGRLAITAPDAPMDVMITLQPMNIVQAAADLLWSAPIKKYPDLKIALSEGGTGWIPYFLERADRTYEMHSTWTGQDFGDKLPSEVFRDHFLTCFISDPVGVALRNQIGIDNICWEADYPHSDSMWPEAPEQLDEVLKANAVPDDEINKMTFENAMRWYHWDPFSHIARDQATVGALRKAAEGHDVSIQALSHHEKGSRGEALHAAARGNSGDQPVSA